MEVYVEVTFLTNFLIILSSLEMMGILLCKEMSYLQVLKESFLLSFSVLLLYIIVGLLFVLLQIMFIVYLKRKVRINSYLYPVELFYDGKQYVFNGFLDSGNEVYYEGFPLILVNEKIIDKYEVIDVVELNDLRSDFIGVIKVDTLAINNQLLENIYVGVIKGIEYDCLLNKSLMGGIL